MQEGRDVTKWGKDHWSLLAYVETACVDEQGKLDRRRMRCNENRHPLMTNMRWNPDYCTRLKEGKIEGHDDWDCLEDLEVAGFIEIISLINGFVRMTELGMRVATQIRSHKVGGGHFATFVLEEAV